MSRLEKTENTDSGLNRYVDQSIEDLNRVFAKGFRPTHAAESAQALLQWWERTEVLLKMRVSNDQLLQRVLTFILRKPHLTDEQFTQIELAIMAQRDNIDQLAEREYPHQPTLKGELAGMKRDMLLYFVTLMKSKTVR